ncbi:anhydro-N-acetylmuramic acid kinase [Rivibacter subsaxonicus]|nr:anhydro-N-acetylmuramic acid kinase [Rivibacter subsaxonicus]
MSGTSTDGVDGVLVRWSADDRPEVLAHVQHAFDPALRAELLALNSPGENELHRAALAANALTEAYARTVDALLADSGVAGAEVQAVGAHGQTVRHRPGAFDGTGYTLQLNAPALLAERCGIDVVADFRSRDLAAGGQAAPLVPVVHRALFARPGRDIAVLNLGGIANLSLLHADGRLSGFDTGPANVLMDLWIERTRGLPYDADGAWAAQGKVLPTLLADALCEPYFAAPAPKSTGRDLFHADWLERLLARHPGVAAADVQSTLCELTVRSVAQALAASMPSAAELLVCGGGALNGELMRRLGAALPAVTVLSTAGRGLPPLQVEAVAFAWLARAHLSRVAGNEPAVTGARGARVLGALYPA